MVGLLQTAGAYGFAMWALVSGGAGKTSVLVYIMPFWTLLLAWLILGERVRGIQWFAIGLSLCGENDYRLVLSTISYIPPKSSNLYFQETWRKL